MEGHRESDDRHAVPDMDFELMGEMETLADAVAAELGIDDPLKINEATHAAIAEALDMGPERDEAALRALISRVLQGEDEADDEPLDQVTLTVAQTMAGLRPVAGVDMDNVRRTLIAAGREAEARLPSGAPTAKVTRRIEKAVQRRLRDVLLASADAAGGEAEDGAAGTDEAGASTVSLEEVDEDVISDRRGGSKRVRKPLEDDDA